MSEPDEHWITRNMRAAGMPTTLLGLAALFAAMVIARMITVALLN